MSPVPEVFDFIQNGPEAGIRAVLRLMCETSNDSVNKATLYYRTINAAQAEKEGSNKPSEVYHVCFHCDNLYTESENHDNICTFHEGGREINEPYWDDFDMDDHEEIENDDETFRDHPDGFIWECCQKVGTSEGCVTMSHNYLGEKPKLEVGNGDAAPETTSKRPATPEVSETAVAQKRARAD